MALGAFNELREKVYTVTRDSGRDFITEDDVDLWIQEAMDDLSSRLHLVQGSTSSTTSGNTIAIPDDYVALIWLEITKSGAGNDYVHWVDEDVWNYHSEVGADPGVWYGRPFNGNFEIYPTPDTGTAYEMRFWKSTDSSLTEFTGTLKTRIVNYARAHAKYKEGEFQAGDRYMGLYEEGLPSRNDRGRHHHPGPLTIVPLGGPFDDTEMYHR